MGSSLFLLLVVTVSILSYSSCNPQPLDFSHLKKVISDSFQCRDNPGMVVAVVKDGKTVFSEPFGVITPESKVKVTLGTKFMIASLTKAFTAALMVDVFANNPKNKSYSLKTPLRDILGSEFEFPDKERTEYGSAEDLLSHRIGLPNKGFMRFNPSINRSDFIHLARDWRTNLTFRGQTKYSSVAYILAAAITEFVGGKSWEDLITERIFKPLGLRSTSFAFTEDFDKDDVAKPYQTLREKKPVDPLFAKVWNSRCGSGCLLSTVEDMTTWMNFLLSGGQNASGHQVMPADQVKTLTVTRAYLRSARRDIIAKTSFPVTSVADEYALGWRNGFYKGYKIRSHSGSSPGVSSMIMLFPEENMGIYVAMNGDDFVYYYRLALVHYIADFMHGQTPWLNASTMCTFPEPWKPTRKPPSVHYEIGLTPVLPYVQYIGAYRSALYGEVFVNFNSSTFLLQAFYGMGSWQLYPQKQDNLFYGKGIWATDFWDMPNFEFLTKQDDSKNVTRVMIGGFAPYDPPVFEKEFN